jgi:outer membrane autotransporter protein
VLSGGTLALQGFDQTLNNGLENAGTVQLGIPDVTASGTTLTVAGNYVGNGGTLAFNAFLGTDGSPSDKLIVNGGTATGSSFLRITNVGGPGAETIANGILVVQATNGATTASNAFSLAEAELRAGAFDYRLFQGAAANQPDPPDVANSWFLRTDFTVPGGGNGNGGVEELPGGGVEFPAEPPPTVLPPGNWPIIGPELATYGVVQPIARQMGLSTLGTLHERVGDAAADTACLNADLGGNSAALDGAAITKAPPVPYENCRQAVWGRLFGQQIDNHYQAFADPRASGQVAGIQTGIDVWRGSLIPGHSDTAGVYFAYGNGNVSVDGLVTNAAATAYVLQHTGSLNLNAYSLGGYWTHYGPTGWYIDAVLQGSFYQGNATTQFANLPTNGTGFISSLEAGYPIPLPWLGPGFVLEPESQIIWQQVSFDDANDGLGPVGLGTTSGASGRLGLRGKWTINDPAGRVWQPYVLANVWRDWGAEATTTFGNDLVPLLEQATRLEFAGGLSAKILPGLSLYAQVGYQVAVSGTDGGTRDGVKGDFGVHYAW